MSSFLEMCISNAIVATALALVAAALGKICKRPPLTHTLWLLVLLKLITPPIIRIPIAWQTDPAHHDTMTAVVDNEETAVTLQPDEQAHERQSAARATAQSVPPSDSRSTSRATMASNITPSTSLAAMTRAIASSARWRSLISARSVVVIWLAGSACWFAAALVRIVQFHQLLRHGKPASDALQQRCASIANRLELGRCPELWIVPGRVSPLLWFLGKRISLILPKDLLESLAPEQQATLLAHELAHARRHDHWVRWLEFVALGLYWWHPVAWLAKRAIRQAEEQCCDAWVVWALPGRARAYAEALLETVGFLSGARSAVPPTASGIGHVQLLRRRLTMILRDSLCPRVSWRVHVLAILLGLGVLPLAPYHRTASAAAPGVAFDYSPAAQTDRDTRDIEQRLDALEKKLEKVINAVEASRETRQPEKPAPSAATKKSRDSDEAAGAQADKAKPKDAAKKPPATARPEAAERAKEAKAAATRAVEQARKDAEAARKTAERAKSKSDPTQRAEKDSDADKVDPEEFARIAQQIAESVRESFDPAKLADLGRQIGEAVGSGIDPQQMAELGRQIGEAVNKGFDAKQMEELGGRIEQIFNQNFSPERMKDLEAQIEQAVTKAIDPQRMEEIERAIEEALSKTLDSDRMKELEQKIEKAAKKAVEVEVERGSPYPKPDSKPDATKRDTPKSAKPKPAIEKGEPDDAGRNTRQLERRMMTLEQKMDRLLEALESKSTPVRP